MPSALGWLFNDSRVRYLFVGGSSVVIEYGLFAVLIYMSMHAGWANALSFLVGFFYTFILHTVWSFAGSYRRKGYVRFTAYVLLAVVNTVITSLIIVLLVDGLSASPFIAKVLCMALVIVWNYVILNKIIFRRSES